MMHTALMGNSGACILFDFASAFPSISQDYLMTVLARIGIPREECNLIDALYDNSFCSISHNGASGETFQLKAGVRQGCPLSPLLYSVIAEVLMDHVERRCSNGLIRACFTRGRKGFYTNQQPHNTHQSIPRRQRQTSTPVQLQYKGMSRPKKHRFTPDGHPTYKAHNTRPLNIVNADNRLIASAARCRWEQIRGGWGLSRQQ